MRNVVFLLLCCPPSGLVPELKAEENLIPNGSFEQVREGQTASDYWITAGATRIEQQLAVGSGRDGLRCGKLECTHFEGSSPDSHAMVCQRGTVSVRGGRWYRLTFWAKGEGIKSGAVYISLVNAKAWRSAGLSEAILAQPKWDRYVFLFQAKEDLPAEASRLQFWFYSTGTLWLDDVTLEESEAGRQWYPQIATQGVQNFVPNSSFECGGANWGSFTYGLRGWGGNLYRLYGEPDTTDAVHGQQCWKLALNPDNLPVFYFDYFDAVKEPVRRVLVANGGWFKVRPEERLCLSAWMRADGENAVAQMVVNQAEGRTLRSQIKVGRDWQRYRFAFTAEQPFLYIALGLDLEASKLDSATLWLDAIQLERGETATEYTPRAPVEAFLESDVPGNIFTKVPEGMILKVHAFNNQQTPQLLQKRLVVADFYDRPVVQKEVSLNVPPQERATQVLRGLCSGRQGYLRAQWDSGSIQQSLRGAIIEIHTGKDSPIGMNHAYPWQFLVEQARLGGILWWRDWTAKWHVVEPEKGKFNWAAPDEQIYRVTAPGGQILALLPFPASLWSTTAREEELQEHYQQGGQPPQVLRVAHAPRDLKDFGEYAAATVRHYRDSIRAYHILNEPLYTTYALPKVFGYKLEDYIRLLETAYRSMKAADPQCMIVGGIGSSPASDLTQQFVKSGGLQWVDVVDMHIYDPPVGATLREEDFKIHLDLMRQHGGPKPIWITEYGCYSDDDPPCIPHSVGDETMNRCRWRSEQEAAEHVVKFAALSFAYGVRKIFFHAGICGTINHPDAGGVFFEYGGAPRKVFVAAAALTRLLGSPEDCIKTIDHDGIKGYVYRSAKKTVAIAWSNDDKKHPLALPPQVDAADIMGNELPPRGLQLDRTPIYLTTPDGDGRRLIEMLTR